MKISEYIQKLEALRFEHGELEVETSKANGRQTARAPVVAHRKALTKRESRPDFWWDWMPTETKGEKVICV